MSSKKTAQTLVKEIQTDLGVKVSPDDPLVLLLYYQQEKQRALSESFQQNQLQLLKTITATLNAKSKKKQPETSLYLGILNSIILVLLLILVVFK